MTLRKIFRFILGLILTLVFIWLIARQINFNDFKRAFMGANPSWIILGLVAFFLGYVCRIERWCLMLQCDNPRLSWKNCAGPLVASFAVNNILPFRAGDVLRAFAFNRQFKVSSGVVVATLFVERLLDLLMVLLLLGTVLTLLGLDINGFAGVGSAVLIAIAFAILLFLLFPQLFSPLVIISGKLVMRLAPKLGLKLMDEINKSLQTLIHLSKGGTMIKLVFWSIAAWLAEGCVFWFSAIALSSIKNPTSGWLALPIGTLSTLIPSTPGYVGTFDYFTARAMGVLGNDLVASTAYALLVHVLLWLPPTLMGSIYMLLNPIKKLTQS